MPFRDVRPCALPSSQRRKENAHGGGRGNRHKATHSSYLDLKCVILSQTILLEKATELIS